MHRVLIPLSVLGLLLLAACGTSAIEVRNDAGRVIGTIELQSQKTAVLMNTHGDIRGRVRGNVVRDDEGKHLGTIVERDSQVMINDPSGAAIGSVNNGKDCYGKSNEKLGTIGGETDAFVAAGACLTFFLQ